MSHTVKLIFIRHGACEGGHILRGRTDVALSAEGQQQLTLRRDDLVSRFGSPERIISSPLKRCAQFASAQAMAFACPCTLDKNWAEMDYGRWDGMTFDEIYQEDEQAFAAFYQNPWQNPAPQAETMLAFEKRVTAAFDTLCMQLLANASQTANEHQQGPVWIVCHAGVMLTVMAHVLGLKQAAGIYSNMHLPYASMMQVNVLMHQGQYFPRLEWPQ